jgi:hypothetical protein
MIKFVLLTKDGDEQKRRLFPKTFQNYPLILPSDEVRR